MRSALLGLALAGCAAARAPAPVPTGSPALDQESTAIANRAGLWDVTETVWASPTEPPVTTSGHIAERRMIGAMLQELLRPAANTNVIERIDYLRFNHAEGRWDYVSMDTRAPVGIMPAWSFTRGDGHSIELAFSPFALPTGMMLRMTEIVTFIDLDHDSKDQRFIVADGSGTEWLAHRYSYSRRR